MVHLDMFFQRLKRFSAHVVCLAIVTVTVVGGAWVPNAQAANVQTLGSEDAAAIVNDRAATELDRTLGAGTSDQLEGLVDSTAGKVKRDIGRIGGDLDKAVNQIDGATDQLKGKVERDIGRAKSAADDASNDIEDVGEGIVESIKNFFD